MLPAAAFLTAVLGLTPSPRARAVDLGRRAALGSAVAVALPSVLRAPPSSAFDLGSDGVDYGLPERPKKKRVRPDGFGGFIERTDDDKYGADPTKPAALKLADKIMGDDGAPAAPTTSRKAKAAARATASSSKPLTIEEMVANSVRQKGELLGRELTKDEADELESKLKALMGA